MTVKEEKATISLANLFSSIGGAMGLALGLSALNIVEYILKVARMATRMKNYIIPFDRLFSVGSIKRGYDERRPSEIHNVWSKKKLYHPLPEFNDFDKESTSNQCPKFIKHVTVKQSTYNLSYEAVTIDTEELAKASTAMGFRMTNL